MDIIVVRPDEVIETQHAGVPVSSEEIVFGNIRLDKSTLRMWMNGREIFPSLTQMKIMLVFLAAPYYVFGYDELVDLLGLPSRPSLTTQICLLRKKLDQRYIHTWRGKGLVFVRSGENVRTSNSI